MNQPCCEHCITKLGLGPRAKRMLLYLVKHPEWNDDHLSGIHFDFLPGDDHSRITYQEIGRKRFEEAA